MFLFYSNKNRNELILHNMVGITSAWLGKGFKSAAARRYDQGWIDRIRLYVRGGSGGNGLPKVGGIGGNGGSITIKASDTVSFN